MEDAIAKLGEDAKLTERGERLVSSALVAKRATHARHQEEDSVGHALHELADEVAHAGLEHVATKGLEHLGHTAAAAGLEAGGAVLHIATAYEKLLDHCWARPHARAEELKQAGRSDAVVVGIALTLDFPDGFKRCQMSARDPLLRQVASVQRALGAEDKALVPVLQSRADAGARLALEIARTLPKEVTTGDRFVAVMEALKRDGRGHELATDPAFGLGVELGIWMLDHLPPNARAKEIEKIDSRDARTQRVSVSHRG